MEENNTSKDNEIKALHEQHQSELSMIRDKNQDELGKIRNEYKQETSQLKAEMKAEKEEAIKSAVALEKAEFELIKQKLEMELNRYKDLYNSNSIEN